MIIKIFSESITLATVTLYGMRRHFEKHRRVPPAARQSPGARCSCRRQRIRRSLCLHIFIGVYLLMAMMQFEYDPESLIEEVKKRPGIWDFDNVDYRTKNTRHKLWTEVVNALMSNDVKISKSERRELELQLQKKWKSMRDCYQKYVTHPNRTKRPYIYSKQLQFLVKNQKDTPHTETGSSESDDGRSKKTSWKPRKKLKLVKDSSEEDNDIDKDDYRSNDGLSMEVLVKQNAYKPIVDEFAFASVDSQSRSETDDPDKMFLLSLLPHLKSIPEEMRLNIKMDIMQVLKNANYQSRVGHKII